MDEEEYKKCCDSPAYFFNNYVLVKDAMGNYVKPEPVTDEQIKRAANLYSARKEYRKQMEIRRWQSLYAAMKIFPDEFQGKKILIATTKEE